MRSYGGGVFIQYQEQGEKVGGISPERGLYLEATARAGKSQMEFDDKEEMISSRFTLHTHISAHRQAVAM